MTGSAEDRASAGREAVEVTLLYFDGCPHWRAADQNVRAAEAEAGITVELRHRQVETLEDAEELGFRGSPTLLIDGVDPFVDADAPIGLMCRLYRTPNGLAGTPTIEQIRAALTADA